MPTKKRNSKKKSLEITSKILEKAIETGAANVLKQAKKYKLTLVREEKGNIIEVHPDGKKRVIKKSVPRKIKTRLKKSWIIGEPLT